MKRLFLTAALLALPLPATAMGDRCIQIFDATTGQCVKDTRGRCLCERPTATTQRVKDRERGDLPRTKPRAKPVTDGKIVDDSGMFEPGPEPDSKTDPAGHDRWREKKDSWDRLNGATRDAIEGLGK